MAGRHRKPPAWRTFLRSLVRSRNRVRTAALRAELAQLRATITRLETELAAVRDAKAAAPGLSLEAPLVRLALSGVEVDRGPDTAYTEIVLTDSSEAELPERELLDPRSARDTEVTDLVPAQVTPVQERRTA